NLTLVLASDYLLDQTFQAELTLDIDDETRDFDPQQLTLILGNAALLQVNEDNPLTLTAIGVGQTTVQYQLDDLVSNEVIINISAQTPVFSELRVVTTITEANVGETLQLAAIAVTETGDEEDITAQANWSSAIPEVATVTPTGEVQIQSRGRSTITATFEALTASINVGSTCTYPSYDREIALNSIFPPLAWTDAYDELGNISPYSLRDIHCDSDRAPTTIAVIVGAGWCTACSTLTRNIIHPLINDLGMANMQVLYIEAENGQYEPATSQFAYRHIDRLIGESPSIRVGDIATSINDQAGIWTSEAEFIRTLSDGSYPSAWVIRTSDMKVIADQNTSDYWLPFLLIAQDPDADWSSPPPPPPPPFESVCGEDDDEVSEPNDTSLRAARLNEGTQTGGICTPAPDFYRFQASGAWRVTLEFDHDVGDLDLYLWDKDSNEPVPGSDGLPIGSYGEGDVETLEYQGSAIISVMGYDGASNVYSLTLELLE
ncbi:MAG: Ig-like domain-containing protein, partial [Bradymonadia bacterium]